MSFSALARRGWWRAALQHDRARRRSSDEGRQFELCQIMWSMRHVVLGAALAIGLHAHGLGQDEALIAAMLGLQLVDHALTRRFPAVAPLVTVFDALLLVTFAALGLPSLLVFIVGIAILGWAATFRPLAAIGAYAMVVVAVIATARHPAGVGADTAMLAFCLLGCIFMVRAIRLNMEARRAAEQEQLIADRIDAIVWEDLPGNRGALKVNKAAERLLGYPAAAWADPHFLPTIVHPADKTRLEAALAGQTEQATTVRMRRADGEWRWLESRTNQVIGRNGRKAFVVGVLLDRTDAIEKEREALAFGHLVASSPIGQMLLHCDGEGPVIDALNLACQRILDLGPDAVGSRLDRHQRPGLRIADLLVLLPATPTSASTPTSIEFHGADGRIHQVTARRIDDDSCSVDFLDVTERVEAGRRLHRQARQDHLTGLANRRAFIEALEARLAEPGHPSAAVLLIDLDRFKDINDSLGHETGDQLLCSIGRRIQALAGPGELVARLGGDEFAIMMPEATPPAASARAAELVDIVNEPVTIGDLRLRVRTSVGIACSPDDADDTSELLRCADVAMFQAKHRGSGAERYDADNTSFGRDRFTLVADLELAIATDQLFLHHQPLIDVATGRIIGTEVLARWNHPTRGLMRPDLFIELAEVSGQMKNLTRWVVRRALRDLAGLGEAGRGLEVSVNLSVRNLYEPDLVDWITAELQAAGIDATRLVVEITESTIMDDQSAALETIHGLRALGVRTWIDDFGTGHSSFARLRSLPVQGIKIDRSFVCAATTSRSDHVVLRGMIELVRSLGLQTVAEGVETAECLSLLERLGCQTAQGYHIGRPMGLEAVRTLLAKAAAPAAAAEPALAS